MTNPYDSQFYYQNDEIAPPGGSGQVRDIPLPTPSPTTSACIAEGDTCTAFTVCCAGLRCDNINEQGFGTCTDSSTPIPAPTPVVAPTAPPAPQPDECRPVNTVIRCIDDNGNALISTGTSTNGICGTIEAYSQTCRVCPPVGTFINCNQFGAGNYQAEIPVGYEGPCPVESAPAAQCVSTPIPTPTPATYTVSLTASPAEGGFVSGTSNLTPTPSTAVVSRIGETVNFSARAAAGYRFDGWYIVNTEWSDNPTPTILTDKDVAYEARFVRLTIDPEAPPTTVPLTITVGGAQGTVTGLDVSVRLDSTHNGVFGPTAGEVVSVQSNQTFTLSAQPDAGVEFVGWSTNTEIIQGDLTTNNITVRTGGPEFSGWAISGLFRLIEDIIPAPTPTSIPEPDPIITLPPVVRWRDCVSEELVTGTTGDRQEVIYNGPGGGTCWEPASIVTFIPNLNGELFFQYQQGSTEYPMAQPIVATNSSTSISYEIKVTTNLDISITPNIFTISPRSTVLFTIQTTPELLNKLAAGLYKLRMSVNIREI